jgi:hypothetical protein
MLAVNGGFTNGGIWTNGDVWTSDFCDPQNTGAADEDFNYFDSSANAISYYAGHGVSGSGDTTTACTSSGACSSPPAGSYGPGFCRRRPGDNFGTCSYNRNNRRLAVANCNAGPPGRGGAVNYSNNNVKWGERASGGAWAGSGNNGGTVMVVLHASLASMSRRPLELLQAFAGIHLLATTMVHAGDTTVVSNKGSSMAARFAANNNGNPAQAWRESLNSSSGGSNCTNKAGTTVYGGGHGFNGCGAHHTMSTGATANESTYLHGGESWLDLQNPSSSAKGNAWMAQGTLCNYDCVAWPFALP